MPRTTHRSTPRCLALLAVVGLCACPAIAETPTVVSTIPADGDFDVDPDLTEIRVEFDQDMRVPQASSLGD